MRFAVILPLFSIVVWVLLVLFPLSFQSLFFANSNRFVAILTRLWLAFPGNRFFLLGMTIPEEQRSWFVMALNLPAFPAELLESIGTWPDSWSPPAFSIFQWRMLTFPLLALPAWSYVGRGIDALRFRIVLSVWDMIGGSCLGLGCATLCGGLAFTLPISDRDVLLVFTTVGFALWALLFATVAVAAVQQGRPKLRIVVQIISGLIFAILILWAWTKSPVPLWEISRMDGSYFFGWRSSLAAIGVAIASQYLSWLMLRTLKLRSHNGIAAENPA